MSGLKAVRAAGHAKLAAGVADMLRKDGPWRDQIAAACAQSGICQVVHVHVHSCSHGLHGCCARFMSLLASTGLCSWRSSLRTWLQLSLVSRFAWLVFSRSAPPTKLRRSALPCNRPPRGALQHKKQNKTKHNKTGCAVTEQSLKSYLAPLPPLPPPCPHNPKWSSTEGIAKTKA